MSVGPFAVEFVVVFLATLIVLHQYGNLRKQHILVTLAVFISWFFSFLIVFILPLDVSNTCYSECLHKVAKETHTKTNLTNDQPNTSVIPTNCVKPWSLMPIYVLPDMWRVVYWSSQLLSWILLPMMQSYVYAGDFTIWGKIKTALFENALWYGSYLVIFGGLLVYVALKPQLDINGENIKLIGITASNTWGLLLLVLLLGYGLVELPRNAWNMSLPDLRLEEAYFKISKLCTEKEDAEEELADVLAEVKRSSEEIKYNSDLRSYIDTIIKKCPPGSEDLFSKGTEDYVDYKPGNIVLTAKNLIKLHKKVIVVSHRAHRTQVQWNAALKLAFHLEDIEQNRYNGERIFKASFSNHLTISRTKLHLTWLWEILIKPWLFKLLSIILLILSISLVWSEMTFFSKSPNLSIFALLIDVTKKDYLYFYIECVSCVTIAYMCACTYYTVFKIKFFNFYYFEAHHQTDSNSLLFSGLLLCRLTYALCLNFLAMIHMDGHITGTSIEEVETQFTKFMGHMDLLSFIAKGFNVYYPMIVLIVCFCTYFSIGKRALHCIGIEQFITDDDFSADYVREGKEITRREKRKLEREINGTTWSERSKGIQDKYSNSGKRKKKSHERIDDQSDDDDEMINPSRANINSKLNKDPQMKYTKFDSGNDRIQLLSDIEYAPPESQQRSLRGYENISGNSRSKVPRNIFDDA